MFKYNQTGFMVFPLVIVAAILLGVGVYYYFVFIATPKNEKTQIISKIETSSPSPNAVISSPKAAVPLAAENIQAISGDIKFSYFLNDRENKKLTFKQVNFAEHSVQSTELPYYEERDDDLRISKYVVSPDNKYIAKVMRRSFEIAELQKGEFRNVYTVPSVKEGNLDYATMGDVIWSDDGTKMYFTTSVGIDGLGSPKSGIFGTSLLEANSDGSNIKTIYGVNAAESIGFMLIFDHIDSARNRAFFTGSTHAGHTALEKIIDLGQGKVLNTIGKPYSDGGNLVFNRDFSKGYGVQSRDYSDGYLPIELMEVDTTSKELKQIYKVSDFTKDTKTPLSNKLFMNQKTGMLYFAVTNNEKLDFYRMNVNTGGAAEKLLSDQNLECQLVEVSDNDQFLFMRCLNENSFYDVVAKKKSVFLDDGDGKYFYFHPTIEVVSLN